jgi:hypothetical protein
MLVALTGQGPERLLDLTGQAENATNVSTDRSLTHDRDCPSQSNGRLELAPSVTITVESLNSIEYSMGGQIIADLRLTNMGRQVLKFPWVRRHVFAERAFFEGAEAVQVGLGLSAIDVAGREHGLAGTILRGSPSFPESLQSIAPGESIRIRFPAWIVMVDGPTAPAKGDAQLFVTLGFRDGECRTWQPVRSQAVKILLR